MLLFKEKRFAKSPFDSESDLERIVTKNYEHIFGPSSIFLPKSKIKTDSGTGTIPDGFAIDLDAREWYIVEAELSHHSIWNHIIPQVTKQIQASDNLETKKLVKNLAVESYSEKEDTKEKFGEVGVRKINIRKFVGEILSKKPIIGIPIDEIPNDLDKWTSTLEYNVKLWVVKKFVEIGDESNVIYDFPENSEPEVDTGKELYGGNKEVEKTDVSMNQLVKSEILDEGDILIMDYNPRGGEKRQYEASLLSDGSLELLNQKFSSPSSAAVAAIQDAGSNRDTENGWRVWKTEDGKSIDKLRVEYAKSQR